MKKRIAIITGATGGLGKEFVRCMLQEDLEEVWAVARNKERLQQLKEEFGPKIRLMCCDLTQYEQVNEILEQLRIEQPELRYLINNAGLAKMASYQELTGTEIQATIAVNCTALAMLSNLCIPYMTRGSKIINLSSQSSFQPVPYINLYASTKAFERSYTRALNVELKGTEIHAMAVCPGWVDTKLLSSEINGKKVYFPGIVSASRVAHQSMKDAKRGKDMSICSSYVKFMHVLSKVLPQRTMMKLWMWSVKKYGYK